MTIDRNSTEKILDYMHRNGGHFTHINIGGILVKVFPLNSKISRGEVERYLFGLQSQELIIIVKTFSTNIHNNAISTGFTKIEDYDFEASLTQKGVDMISAHNNRKIQNKQFWITVFVSFLSMVAAALSAYSAYKSSSYLQQSKTSTELQK